MSQKIMPKLSCEGLVLSLILLCMVTYTFAKPRRRFCENFPFARRCIGVSAKRDVRGRYDMSKRRGDQVTTLDAVEKLLMEKSSLENDESYEDYGDGWDFVNGKEESMESDYPSNILKKIIKRKSVNTDIISQERMPTVWVDYRERK